MEKETTCTSCEAVSETKLQEETCCCHEEKHDHSCNHDEEHEVTACHHHSHHEEGDSCCCCGHDDKEEGCSCCGVISDKPNRKVLIKNETARQLIILGISLVFLIIGFFPWKEISVDKGMKGLLFFYYVNPSWVAIILCGSPMIKEAFELLFHGKVKVPVLVTVAIFASIGLEIASFFIDFNVTDHGHSYIFAAGEISFLMCLGEWLESLTVKKCKSGIARLVGLIPKEAFVKVGDKLEKRSLQDVKIGDIVVCKSGELVAVDGEIIKGSCSIDQSSVTGEYLPVDLKEGDSVYGGTMNINGTIEIEVKKLLKDMTVAKMAELVKEAEGKKAPIARIADKFAQAVVPLLILLSPIWGLISYFGISHDVIQAIVTSITVLIVFCPCAFALATPTAVAAGLGNGAKNGILIKSGESLEEINRTKVVCFDKTGTLTSGKLQLTDIVAHMDEEEMMRLVASVEKYSEHPLSIAIVEGAKVDKYLEANNIVTISGVGIKGQVDNKEISIVSYKSFVENLSADDKIKAKELMSQGKTVVCVLIDENYVGLIALSDTIREDAKVTIEALKKKGYKTVMLTGDHKVNAEFVANQIGIDEIYADLLPEDKMNVIKKMQSEGKKVCMLGDGINDAPSLKLADVSFVVGAMSSDIALDSADMAILNDQIEKVDYTISLGRRVMRTIKTTLSLAMIINVVSLMLSLFGYLNPVTGALIHNLSSVFVISLSALILLTPKKYKNKFQTK